MKDWKKLLIKKDDSIFHVLEILNSTGSKFTVAVDENYRVIGSVTDGDIRRGLLKGIQIQEPVEKIMNNNPKSLPVQTTQGAIAQFMKQNDVYHLPLLNDEQMIVDIITASDIEQVKRKENHVVLMAGGLGSRMAGLTADCPKPMLKVGGEPVLEKIIEYFKKNGFYKFIISVNYKSEMIEDYFGDGSRFDVEISYIKENTRLGTAGALSMYKSNDLPFIVMNGDLLTKINFTDLIDSHIKSKNMATMCLKQYEHKIPFGVVITDQDQVLKIEEKPAKNYFVNGGIYVLDPAVLKYIPSETYFDMPTFFEKLIEAKHTVRAYPIYEYWIDIGSADDYQRAHAEFTDVFR